ncbi:MAG TPA: hypothetical protein VFV75_12655 [Candidatus Polarisedimenticolaceae bacterium]|nr:hypothetical protein [Candidatus Polarisedimenticolaceae bacterium]
MNLPRTRSLLLLLTAVLAVTTIPAKTKRHDAGRFLIRRRNASEEVRKDDPSYVAARKALWDCWKTGRACELTLQFDYGLDRSRRQDVFLDVRADGTRTLLLRDERRSKSAESGVETTRDGPSDVTRRFSQLERIPMEGKWDSPALPDDDASPPERWRLRFSGGEPVPGAPSAQMLGDSGSIALW